MSGLSNWPSVTPRQYSLYIDDNFHYADDSERQFYTEFTDEDEALRAARLIVDDFLQDSYKPGMSATELFQLFTGVGEEPFITHGNFTAWSYAEQRCRDLCR